MTKNRISLFIIIVLALILLPTSIPVLAHVDMPFWANLIYATIVLVNFGIFLVNYYYLIDKYLVAGRLLLFVGYNVALVFVGLGLQYFSALFFESFPTGTDLQVSDVVDIPVRISQAALAIVIETITIFVAVAIVLSDEWKLASFRYNDAVKGKEKLESEYQKLENKIADIEQQKKSLERKNENVLQESLSIKVDLMMTKVRFDDISFIKSDGDYIVVHTGDGKKLMTLMTMKNVEKQLPFGKFCRVHRSYIVNMDKVNGTKEKKVIVLDNQIPLSDTYKASFYELLSHKSLILKSQ